MDSDNTGRKQGSTLFKPGQSGNPKGRPKGSRNKFAEVFLADFVKSWEEGGKDAIQKVRTEDPATYLRVAASILPKETETTIRHAIAKELADDELADIALGGSEGAAEPAIDPSQLN
jgi:hypothetical protein